MLGVSSGKWLSLFSFLLMDSDVMAVAGAAILDYRGIHYVLRWQSHRLEGILSLNYLLRLFFLTLGAGERKSPLTCLCHCYWGFQLLAIEPNPNSYIPIARSSEVGWAHCSFDSTAPWCYQRISFALGLCFTFAVSFILWLVLLYGARSPLAKDGYMLPYQFSERKSDIQMHPHKNNEVPFPETLWYLLAFHCP